MAKNSQELKIMSRFLFKTWQCRIFNVAVYCITKAIILATWKLGNLVKQVGKCM